MALRFVYRMAIPFAERRGYSFALPLVAERFPHRWGVSGYGMGSIGDAAPYEYLLSALHPTGRLWLPTTCGLQPRPYVSHRWRTRQASPNDEYGFWLQCRWGGSYPHYQQSARKAHRYHHQ